MGAGSWSTSSFRDYSTSKGYTISYSTSTVGKVDFNGMNATQIYTSTSVDKMLNPYKVMRECRESDEHPNTRPLILTLDVSGSMSDCLVEVASSLNDIITRLLNDKDKLGDLEICVMGIGDLIYDDGAIQIGQFESDIRIAEQLDKIWFERGGGGNLYESYTAAWYMGARHTDLDCWKRGEKGVIITLGDEMLNPYLPQEQLAKATGDSLQGDIETGDLYIEASQKYDLYHIFVDHNSYTHKRCENDAKSFKDVIGENNVFIATVNEISDVIVDIVSNNVNKTSTVSNDMNVITW